MKTKHRGKGNGEKWEKGMGKWDRLNQSRKRNKTTLKKVRNKEEELLMTKGKLVSSMSKFNVKIQFSVLGELISAQVFTC